VNYKVRDLSLFWMYHLLKMSGTTKKCQLKV